MAFSIPSVGNKTNFEESVRSTYSILFLVFFPGTDVHERIQIMKTGKKKISFMARIRH
jgi:hypothetical protein